MTLANALSWQCCGRPGVRRAGALGRRAGKAAPAWLAGYVLQWDRLPGG
jgi:hypothetical protein